MDSLEQARTAAGSGGTGSMERAKLLVLADIAESLRILSWRQRNPVLPPDEGDPRVLPAALPEPLYETGV